MSKRKSLVREVRVYLNGHGDPEEIYQLGKASGFEYMESHGDHVKFLNYDRTLSIYKDGTVAIEPAAVFMAREVGFAI